MITSNRNFANLCFTKMSNAYTVILGYRIIVDNNIILID